MSSAAGRFNRNRRRLTRPTDLEMRRPGADPTRHHPNGKPLRRRGHSAFSASCSSLVISSVVASASRRTGAASPESSTPAAVVTVNGIRAESVTHARRPARRRPLRAGEGSPGAGPTPPRRWPAPAARGRRASPRTTPRRPPAVHRTQGAGKGSPGAAGRRAGVTDSARIAVHGDHRRRCRALRTGGSRPP